MGGKPKARGESRKRIDKGPRKGSTFDSFLEEEGIKEEVEADAMQKLVEETERLGLYDQSLNGVDWRWANITTILEPRVLIWRNQNPLTLDEWGNWGSWDGSNTVLLSLKPQDWVDLMGRPLVDYRPVKVKFGVTFIGGLY